MMTGWRTSTLRFRLLLVAAVCILGVLTVAGAALVATFEHRVLEMIGRDLDIRWEELAQNVAFDASGKPQLSETVGESRYEKPRGGAYWQMSQDGRTVLRSPSLEGRDMDLHQAGEARQSGRWFEIEGPELGELYIVERDVPAGPPGAASTRLAVALDHEQVALARRGFRDDAIFVLGLIALGLVAAAGVQASVILAPLTRLREELAAIREGRQNRLRSAVPAEVAPLAEDLNRLLGAQEELLKKARERAGALAHGLKTPIAVLTAECRRLEEEGQGAVAARLREEVTAIQTHVERELARARARGATTGLGAFVDAGRTAERLTRVMSRMPRGEELSWRCEAPDELMLRMDPDDFGEILGNLLDNARKFAASAVTVRCETAGDTARVTVEDDGPGFGSNAAPTSLTAGDRESSAGLGLIIVQDMLAVYGSALWIDRAAANGVVSFTLPAKLLRPAGAARSAQGEARSEFPLGGLAPSQGDPV